MWAYNQTAPDELYHHGIIGMPWGIRRTPVQLGYSTTDSAVTRRVKENYNTMNDTQFMNKYHCSKATYAKRVAKYGDPYKNSPYAKLGRRLNEQQKKIAVTDRNKSYKANQMAFDLNMYGKKGRQRINNRMNKGSSHAKAATIEFGRHLVTGMVTETMGAMLVYDILSGGRFHRAAGKAIANSIVKRKAHNIVPKLAADVLPVIDVTKFKVMD